MRIQHYRCNKCGRDEEVPDNFYKSNSTLYNNGGCMPICKECLSKLYTKYVMKYNDKMKAIKRICMTYDLYYNEDAVLKYISKSKQSLNIGDYIKALNMVQHKGKTFETSIDEGFNFYDTTDGEVGNKNDISILTTIPKSVRARWGSGFTDAEYVALEEHYKFLKNANPNCDSNQEIFITDLCFIKMQQLNALKTKSTDDYIRLSDSYRKTFTQAGLKTTRDVSESENFTIGVTAETIEKYTPTEFYKDKKLFADYDNIGDYIERFMLRPLRNLMFGTHDRDTEYYVKDEDEDNGFDEEE